MTLFSWKAEVGVAGVWKAGVSFLAGILLLGVPVAEGSTLSLRQAGMALKFDSSTASAQLTDLKTGAVWDLGVPACVWKDGRTIPLQSVTLPSQTASGITFVDRESGLSFRLRLVTEPLAGVEYGVSGLSETGPVASVALLAGALTLGDASGSYYAIPKGLGIEVSASGAAPSHKIYTPYHVGNGYSMAFLGAVKNGSALLVSWDNPYTDIVTDFVASPGPRLTAGFALHPGAQRLLIAPLGEGSYVQIAQAYRMVTKNEGFLKATGQVAQPGSPAERMIGAAELRPIAYVRKHSKADPSSVETHTYTTFAEVAELAEHLKTDVGIDKAMLVISGWTQAGYDNELPRILPAAAQAGGNEGLEEASRRIKAAGFLFGLHDNYQDMYRDSPDWNPADIVKKRDGSLMQGGFWAGGQAYVVCSRVAERLMLGPQNLPEVQRLFRPDIYFLDTVFASPLRTCYDTNHPTTPAQDAEYRQKLGDTVRQRGMFFGSEEGNELGVGHADFFEGMMSQKGRSHVPGGETILPLFPLVYGDRVRLFTHQSDKLQPEGAAQFLDDVLYAQMPLYFTPQHRYWGLKPYTYRGAPGTRSEELVFAQGVTATNAYDLFLRNTYEVLSPLARETVGMAMTDHRFLTADRSVEMTRFGPDVSIYVNYGTSAYVTPEMELPEFGFAVDTPGFVAVYARRYRQFTFDKPTMLTLRPTDGKPWTESHAMRIFRAFGDDRIALGGKTVSLGTETAVKVE